MAESVERQLYRPASAVGREQDAEKVLNEIGVVGAGRQLPPMAEIFRMRHTQTTTAEPYRCCQFWI